MGFFDAQNPGIGGLDEITDAEALFLQNLAGLSYSQGDVLYHNGSDLINLGKGTGLQYFRMNAGATAPEWATLAAGGDVSKVGTPVDNQVGVWTGDGTIEGTTGLTYDGSNLQLTGDIGSTGTRITKGWFTDLEVTNAIAGSITGSAPTLTTARAIYGNNFDGSADLTQVIASTYGGTGNGFTKFSGATTAEKTYTLPDANATLLYSGGALGTPSGGTLTNCTGLPISTGVSGLGANVATFLATPSSANLATAVTDETGTGALVFATSPTLVTPLLGTPTSGTLTNCTGYVGDSSLVTVGTVTTGNVDAVVSASSTTTAGKVELATTAEIDTGTDTTRAMPVDQFVASKRNIRWLVFNLVEATTDCATGTNIGGDFLSPIAGTVLQSDTTPFYLYATNSTAGTTGTMTIDINFGGTSIMTTNKITIDSTEKTSTTAATPPDVTDTSLAVGDIITIDVDAVHTTAAKGLTVYMAIRE